MSTFKNIISVAAAAVLMLSGSAFAATAFAAPAAGNAPYFDDATVTSQLQRAMVEAEVAASLPAAGESSAHAAATHAASDLTRADVERSIVTMPAAGEAA